MDRDELRKQAERARARADEQMAEIHSQRWLSDEGRRAQLAQVVVRTGAELAKLRMDAAADAAKERAELERRLWADPGADLPAWRDALARAAAVADGEEATRLYERARRSGDDQLAKAVLLEGRSRGLLERGFNVGGPDVPAEWAEAFAALDAHDQAEGDVMTRMEIGMLTSPPEPPELAGVNAYQLSQLAAAAEAEA